MSSVPSGVVLGRRCLSLPLLRVGHQLVPDERITADEAVQLGTPLQPVNLKNNLFLFGRSEGRSELCGFGHNHPGYVQSQTVIKSERPLQMDADHPGSKIVLSKANMYIATPLR